LNSAHSAAVNTFAFGAYRASGDACGRCFKITSNKDPYSPTYTGPFNTIVVRVNDLCPMDSNQEWCGQTASNPLNQHGMSMQCVPALPLDSWYAGNKPNRSFDLCTDSGAAGAFFPSDRHAMTGTFEEVQCAGNWIGSDANEGKSLWDGSCLADDNSPLWPTAVCGNQGTKHSTFACAAMQF
jgi:hypothetical protein